MITKIDAANLEELASLLGLPDKEVGKLRIRLELVSGILTAIKKNIIHTFRLQKHVGLDEQL